MEQPTIFRNAKLGFEADEPLLDLALSDGRIESIGASITVPDGATVCDLGGARVVAGLIDLQVNGFAGAEVYDATVDSLRRIVAALPQTGCTSVLLTMISAPRRRYDALFDALDALEADAAPGARVLGVHFEGPYLNPEHAGAHPLEALRLPDLTEARELLDRAAGRIKLWTIAPELPGSDELVQLLVERGVVVSIGHSGLAYEEAHFWFGRGVLCVTHLFNAMTGFHHRAPGLPAAALLDSRVRLGLIADGTHLSPETVRLVSALAGSRIVLVTDAVAAAGADSGEHAVAGTPGRAEDGVVRRPDGRLAGSAISALESVGNLAAWAPLPMAEAFEAMSKRPADLLGRSDLGRLEPGALADLLVLDEDGTIRETWIDGRRCYAREAGWLATV